MTADFDTDNDNGADAQDMAEVFDETSRGADEQEGENPETPEELPELFDATRAVGDTDDDAALTAEDLDDDEIIELEADAAEADPEDDELNDRMDDWLASDRPEEGDDQEIGSNRGLGRQEARAAREERTIPADDAPLDFMDDPEQAPDARGRKASRMETREELSNAQLEDLGYRSKGGPV